METFDSQQPRVKLCSVPNEVEATLILQMLNEEGVFAISDATPGSTIFGGLPFESGHHLFVTHSQLEKAKEVLAKHPHFKSLDVTEAS